MKKIVLAVDESEMTECAAEWIVTNIKFEAGDELHLVHVTKAFQKSSDDSVMDKLHARFTCLDGVSLVRKLIQEKESVGFSVGAALVEYIEMVLEKERILDAESKLTLVLGSRERGFFQRAFLGSVSEYCTLNSPCPVVVVKMPVKT